MGRKNEIREGKREGKVHLGREVEKILFCLE